MLSSYPSNWFLLSRRGTERDKGECPVSIQSLCTLHNAIASFRFQISVNSDLTKDGGFEALQPNWILYQKKHAARYESMKKAHRIDPVIAGREIVNLPSACALRGTKKDLTVGGKDDTCSHFTCSLRPERDNASPPSKFSDLYSKRSTTYNETKLNKISEDQLINFQLLVRMEIQFLSGYDVEWHPSIGNPAEGGANSTGSQQGDSGCSVSQGAESQPIAAKDSESQNTSQTETLSLLQPKPPANAAGSIASAEDQLLRYALRRSILDLNSLNGEECHGEACSPTAGLTGAQSSDSTEVQGDISDIVNWGYIRGDFPLTPQGLLLMEFDYEAHPLPPKYVFPAAILLFVCAKRSVEEEAAYQRLCQVWKYWFDFPLSYGFLKADPPLRLKLTHDEIEWCKVKLDYLVKQITSDSDREVLGLPMKKSKASRETEAAALLMNQSEVAQSRATSNPAPRDNSMADTSAANAPVPRAPAAASGSDSVNGGDDNA